MVDASAGEGQVLPARLGEIDRVEVMGVADDRKAAKAKAEALQPDVLLVDLMLPGYRSLEIVYHVADEQPQVHVLAQAPPDPRHDRIMLAAEAGALGYVCRDVDLSEFEAAIKNVHQGKPWLPLHQTYEVLQDGASELAISREERRNGLTQVVLRPIPLTGLVASVTAHLWRKYWEGIGVDPTTRMIDVLVVIGTFGPLLFVRSWVASIGAWVEAKPRLARAAAKGRGFHLVGVPVGRFVLNQWVARLLVALLFTQLPLSPPECALSCNALFSFR